VGRVDQTNPTAPRRRWTTKPLPLYVGGIVESNPTWYAQHSMVVFVDTKQVRR